MTDSDTPTPEPEPDPEPIVYLQPGEILPKGSRLDLTAPYSLYDRTGKAWVSRHTPPGPHPRVCTVDDIETRRFAYVSGISYNAEGVVTYNNPMRILADFSHESWIYEDHLTAMVNADHYIDYQGRHSLEPVNQVPHVRKWLKHIATFAHEIDTLFSTESILLRKEDNYKMIPGSAVRDSGVNLRNQTALQYGRAICGYAFQRTKALADMSPTSERTLPEVDRVRPYVEALCLVCNHAHWLRQFLYKHDTLPWRNALDEVLTHPTAGTRYKRVPLIDKSSEPWQPSAENFTTIGGNAPDRWYKQQMVNYGKAVDYYDENYGRRDD